MRIAMLASEATPFATTGGLGDVMGALPAAIARLGHEVSLFLPLHRGMRDRFARLPDEPPIAVRMHDGVEQAELLRAGDAPAGVAVYAIGSGYFDRPHLYGEATADYADNARRFTFFCRAALAAMHRLAIDPDVIHCHDWQTALVPAYLRAGILAGDAAAVAVQRLKRTAVVFTVHNLGYQGVFPPSDFAVTGLPRSLFAVDGLEFHGKLNLLKAGLLWADHITTVSPRYAREIRTPVHGAGLEGVLQRRAADLTGILNGIDVAAWDPASDTVLVARYSAQELHGKRRCKADLLLELELEGDLETPIAAVISRIAAQKGVDVLLAALPELVERGLRVAVLGRGEPRLEAALRDAAARAPGRVAFRCAFDPTLAHRIQAGADVLLMPSRYEPCGLTQLVALRYGTVPVVSATGGLVDTVIDMASAPQQATGFWCEPDSPESLREAVERALSVYSSPQAWPALMRRGMAQDFSWTRSAARYVHLYEVLRRRGQVAERCEPAIRFGTAGWRGVLADDFTMAAVSALAQGIAEHLLADARRPALAHQGVLVARDTRFFGREFAERVAGVLAANDVAVLWADHPLPAPAISHAITRGDLAGGVSVTASHDGYAWNGIKFWPSSGGPALPETTSDIERRANAWLASGRVPDALGRPAALAIGVWRDAAFADLYRHGLAAQIDAECIRASGVRIAVDLLWGTARGFLDRLLGEWGACALVLHAEDDPTFGGGRPEPGEEELRELAARVRDGGLALGVATDCDADRFGVVDADGTFVSANYAIALLLDYLCETRPHLPRRVGRSVATTHLVDRVARARGIGVVETPVGFKFLGELLARGEVMLAAEESGGLSIQGHTPDKDGILACLLLAEMVARRRCSLREMLDRLFDEVGRRVPLRRDLEVSSATRAALAERVARHPDALAGFAVERMVAIDGAKLVCEGDRWVLLRASGTEPIVRLHAEGESAEEALALLDDAERAFLD
jgi:starch synthase